MKRIVCIGGGTGHAQLLKGLSGKSRLVTGVVGTTDNGGHTGVLRRELGIPAVGDLRNCIESLTPEGPWKELLAHRFRGGEGLQGVSLGNLILASHLERGRRLSDAVRALSGELGLAAEVLPVSDANSQVCASLEGGREVHGEWEIILRRPQAAVRRLFHRPPLPASPEVLARVRRADLIVFAPGSLLTGVLATVVAAGLRSAIEASKAPKALVVNLMTQPGQTEGLGAAGHLELFERLSGVRPGVVVVNTGRPAPALLRRYGEKGAELVEDDLGAVPGLRVLRGDFIERVKASELARYSRGTGRWKARPHFIRHDSRRLAKVLAGLLEGR